MLLVNKPKGMVSKDVSRRIERLYGRQKLGHIGTLDPMAEGVLPLLFGRATRLQDLLVGIEKEYIFDVAFGSETDSLDSEGEVIECRPVPVMSLDDVHLATQTFVGQIRQIPPLYSAIKYKGRPLYDYARKGESDSIPLEDLEREVVIKCFDALSLEDGVARFRVRCSKGTYVRSLARDISRLLGTCGTVVKLVRSESSGCSIDDTHSLEVIEAGFEEASALIIPIENIPLEIPKWQDVADLMMPKLWMGQKVSLEPRVFESGLMGQSMISMNHASLLFVNKDNRALGIGESQEDGSGRVRLSLKRGLV